MSSIVVIFVVLVVALVSLSWYQANVLTGSQSQQAILSQFAVNDVDYRLQNSLLYLRTGLGMAAANGSWEAGNFSGRLGDRVSNRYWYCSGSPQPPGVDVVRNTTANFTARAFKERMEEVHDIRDSHLYRVGDLRCVEVGYSSPRDTADNDHWTAAARLSNVSVSTVDGGVARREENVTESERVLYNRFWYMYSVLDTWVETEDLMDAAKTEVSESVPDRQSKSNEQCLSQGETCDYPEPPFNCVNHCNWVRSAVMEGLGREMQKLENNEDYFNGTGVECSVTPNQVNGRSFPGVGISPQVGYSSTNQSDKCASGGDEWRHTCTTAWRLQFTALVDVTVTCEDQRFYSVPGKEDLEPVRWRIDISDRFTTFGNGDPYTCSNGRVEPAAGCRPVGLRTCGNVRERSRICASGVNTVGTLE